MESKKKWFFILAFIEGGSVMAIELLGAKMLAIYYGNSLYVWTSVLSITLAGLAAGYFAGGPAHDSASYWSRTDWFSRPAGY